MTVFTNLLDGGLSVKVAGVERNAKVHGLEWESTNQGDGAASFWMETASTHRWSPQADYPELLHGATAVVDHTLNTSGRPLYSGWVCSDPRTREAAPNVVTVECAGALEVAKGRGDMGYVIQDGDTSQWFANKRNAKCYSVDTSDRVDIRVGKGVNVWKESKDTAGVVGYVAYLGAPYLLQLLPGIEGITAKATWDLHDDMKAALAWAPAYKLGRDLSDYTLIHQFSTNTSGKDVQIPHAFGGTSGAGYLVLLLWTDASSHTTTDERFVTLEDVVLTTDSGGTLRVDQGMLRIAQTLGLASSYVTSPIGSVLQSLVARHMTDPPSALATLAAQAECLVEWGWFQGVFRAAPMLTDPSVIRARSNCFLVDGDAAAVDWGVCQHPEDIIPKAVRLTYGRLGSSNWPPGAPASVVSLGADVNTREVGFSTAAPFHGATAPVLAVDFSGHNMSDAHAHNVARKLARHLGAGLSHGPVTITSPTVPVYGGGSWPAPFIRGGDFMENLRQPDLGPLYVTRAHVVADTGYVDMDVGISADLLIEQLAAAGAVDAVPIHTIRKKKKKKPKGHK